MTYFEIVFTKRTDDGNQDFELFVLPDDFTLKQAKNRAARLMRSNGLRERAEGRCEIWSVRLNSESRYSQPISRRLATVFDHRARWIDSRPDADFRPLVRGGVDHG